MPRKAYTLIPDIQTSEIYRKIHDVERVIKSGNVDNPQIEMVTNTSDAGRYREIHNVEGCSAIIYDYQPTTKESKTICVIEVVGKLSRITKARDRLAEIVEAELVEQSRD